MKSGAGEEPFPEDDDVFEEEGSEDTPDAGGSGTESSGGQVFEESESTDSTMVEEIVENLEALEEGEMSNNIGIRHDNLKAMLAAIDDSDELCEELVALGDAVGKDWSVDDVTASDVVRAATVLGLQEAAPGALEALEEAKNEHSSGLM